MAHAYNVDKTFIITSDYRERLKTKHIHAPGHMLRKGEMGGERRRRGGKKDRKKDGDI